MHNHLIYRDAPAIKLWLLACLLLVACMVMVGGYTRLSGSGLSITQWKPVHGVVPPLDISDWWVEFEAYRATPQYEKVNAGMTLDEFKTIYWPEYFHRLLGRMVGFVFLLPLIVFAAWRSISKRLGWRLAGIFALGGLQGLVGWLMVKSGLVDNPYVSPLRLALHLSIAFAIFGLLLWTLLNITSPLMGEVAERSDAGEGVGSSTPLPNPPPQGGRGFLIWFFLLCLQIILGAVVAGMKAGLIYNTFPTMNGEWLPDNPDRIALVQFAHRWLAAAVVLGFFWWWHANRAAAPFKASLFVMFLLALQFTLGVATLLYAVPLGLALAHQGMALVLFGAAVVVLYKIVTGDS